MDNLGYCCINQALREQEVYTSRNLIRRTFTMEKASALALQNCLDLQTILEWNVANDIRVFRISSNLFPRMTDKICVYDLDSLSTANQIRRSLAYSGKYAYEHGLVLSCHPGPYTVLGSDNEDVVEGAIMEIDMHTLLGKMLLVDAPDLQFHINFHVGNRFSSESGERFCRNFERLSSEAQGMVIVENDDKANCWDMLMLYEHIHRRIGIPLTFDYHHSQFSRKDGVTARDEFELAKKTWGSGILREVHYSSSVSNTPAHDDYILEAIPDWLLSDPDIYIHLEAKEKERAVIRYRKEFLK